MPPPAEARPAGAALKALLALALGLAAWTAARGPEIGRAVAALVGERKPAALDAVAAVRDGVLDGVANVVAVRDEVLAGRDKPGVAGAGRPRNAVFDTTAIAAATPPRAAPPTHPAPSHPVSSPAPELAPAPPADPAFDLATRGYAALAAGDRRGAARWLGEALARRREPAWAADRAALTRRWAGEAYLFARENGPAPLAPTPLLGGGQAGARLEYTPDPLARRPLALALRFASPLEGDGAQAAAGVAWRPAGSVTLAAERLVALDAAGRDAWTLRAASGAAGRAGRLAWDAYGEAGVVGARAGDLYAAGQARLGMPLAAGRATVTPGIGAWGSVEAAGDTVHRVDIGPTLGVRAGPVNVRVDWRLRISGAARPGSGVALTVAAGF